ncbi:alpha/beta hydrolase [Edaphobacter sp. 12200R-103]|jgi:pimeloyl-ACP methyl ester carboxylesterase|uniref:alpha/beta hydrolase n=1 Tax=Edaphobacter sp. 12200R-103 TaxID=2703788 RepID=UPI00138C08A1|nr:alpha/beta hydrolase [Edaphobacter sp. 12200R-103]QHS53250.1 alpha/beta hydrolase [Edaphobacter sp. 12200R-103]
MKIGKVIREVLSAGLLLTAGFHNVGYAQQNPESSQDKASRGVRNIVLVHGAWADGSSWSGVIPLLEKDGYHVIAVQLPLTSLADDDAVTERAIARITTAYPGPVLLVGHSYGGVVIGDTPGNDANVVGLVYVAAFAPDTGESALSLLGTLKTPSPLTPFLNFDPAFQFVTISAQGVAEAFAQDLPKPEQALLTVTQGPASVAVLSATPTVTPAWRTKPSWFIVAAQDKAITAGLEEQMAQKINATTITLPTCHLAMLQEPRRVAQFIEQAATSVEGR